MATKTYSEKLLDPRWQQMRLRVFERDGFQCVSCGSKTKTLNAHHSHYHPLSEGPWDYDMDTIFTLCADCHSDEHANSGASKASVLLALAKIGFWSEYEMGCLCDILGVLTKDDLTRMFLEKSNGKNQNS
jgi:hypothetical protein